MNLPANLFFINAAGESVPVSAADPLPTTAAAGPEGAITSNDITDATAIGKAVLTAADEAAARAAIGVPQAAAIANFDTEAPVDATMLNTILAALRASGVIAT